ncbi:sigma-70 family RNA polymerase sigma factor [Streptomyces sp. KM273126]|uniref:RNA polymerase sigma factor n=1 Tax=Streptomyces sp. KM273126 TaxID=2545247 RepID=UPI00103ED292|nr:sigma-70 family RNA polymerase sigma factor [Streptomyces sp. KM273126]MBA2811167.1 sigma-70 family RNA polymerase sigma factor [Streptomyces sp. KM273126]
MSHDDALEGDPPSDYGLGLSQSMFVPLDLPLDFEAFYLGHQTAFHAYAEVHFGTRAAAEEVIHEVFLEIHAGWTELLSAGNLEQGAWAIVRRAVHDRLELEGRAPAFVINGPIAQALAATRDKLQKMESTSGLYEAIAELPNRQFEVIVLRYLLGYPTTKVAWFVGIDERTVGHHLRRGKERLRIKLGLPDDRKKPKKKGEGT